MSRYVIELRPDCKVVQQICESNGQVCIGARSIQYLEELTADYINEHFGSLQDDAYKRGLEDGKKATWEAVRKVIHLPEGVVLDLFTDCYSSVCTVLQVFLKYEGSEVIEKLKAYEEKQSDKIKVGDEVVWTEDENVVIVVTSVYTADSMEWCDGFCKDGKVYSILTENVRKTNRHFDIKGILEAMKHD